MIFYQMVKLSYVAIRMFVKKRIMAQKTKWIIDTNHSEVQFKVKHLMIAYLPGRFKIFKGEVESGNDDFNNSEISFEIDANSIDTYNEVRDGHLRSAEFLDTEKFPTIVFKGLLQKKADNYQLHGELTLRDVQKSIQLDVEFTGIGQGRYGDMRAGFEVNGKLNRKDFGINFGLLTNTGSLVVDEEIKLHFDIQLTKQ
jgi:polyisoprenoid-binding protein YceI